MSDRGQRGAAVRWSIFAAYLALTYWFSSRPPIGGVSVVPDVLLHTVEFSVLTLFLLRALRGRFAGPHPLRIMVGTFAFGVVYAMVDEFHQSFVPGREASVKDFLVDAGATMLTLAVSTAVGRAASSRAPEAGGAGG